MLFIDINSDVGEGVPYEAELFPHLSSCNIACGGHYGTAQTMLETVTLALMHKVKIGAHPSYPDTANFGRVSLDITLTDLIVSIRDQVGHLFGIIKQKEGRLHHIKAHGALYNDIVKHDELANAFLTAIEPYGKEVLLYVPYASAIEKQAIEKGFRVKREAFGDRNYNGDLSLVSRTHDKALITSPSAVLQHIVQMVKQQEVSTIWGEKVKIYAETYCIHGDTHTALQILQYLSVQLPIHNICVQK